MVGTLRSRMAPADICRANGWGVGTQLRGTEGYGYTVIEITAIGEHAILAKALSHAGRPESHVRENSWTLDCRDWQPVKEST